jgi:membrane protease YdiL (CAAX protease family)
MLVIPFAGTALIGAILVLLWARFSRTSWREIGYVRPKSWIHILVVGIAFGVAFKFLMKTMVMPLLGANPINQAYHYIAGNPAAVLQMAVFVIVGAGFGEETVYRGFLFERFGKLFGTGLGAKGLTVLLTSIWFGQVHHADQGMAGAEQAAIMGLVFGAVFAITGRIFMLMFAHAAFDLTALAMIYWNVETKVAHLVFK